MGKPANVEESVFIQRLKEAFLKDKNNIEIYKNIKYTDKNRTTLIGEIDALVLDKESKLGVIFELKGTSKHVKSKFREAVNQLHKLLYSIVENNGVLYHQNGELDLGEYKVYNMVVLYRYIRNENDIEIASSQNTWDAYIPINEIRSKIGFVPLLISYESLLNILEWSTQKNLGFDIFSNTIAVIYSNTRSLNCGAEVETVYKLITSSIYKNNIGYLFIIDRYKLGGRIYNGKWIRNNSAEEIIYKIQLNIEDIQKIDYYKILSYEGILDKIEDIFVNIGMETFLEQMETFIKMYKNRNTASYIGIIIYNSHSKVMGAKKMIALMSKIERIIG